jgi:[ribosomal protein S5]-alanine N-acetyltransferase
MTIVETRRLKLQTMEESDKYELLKTFSDPKVAAVFSVSPFGIDEMQKWVQRNIDHQNRHGYGLFSVILKSTGHIIGDCGLENKRLDGAEVVELGYDMQSNYWNKGYATEAAIGVRDFAFNRLALQKLVSLIQVGNYASKRVAEKVGMQLSKQIIHDGRQYWLYSIQRQNQYDPKVANKFSNRRRID